MDKSTTEYLEKFKSMSLSSDAKLRMRDELSSFADFHAVREGSDVRSIKQMQSNSVFALFTHSKSRIMNATLLIALMIGTGGTAFAAQNTVPGDFLYPVKVHVNENVRSSLALGADAEAKLQAEFFAERLEEARTLALKGNHNAATGARVRAGIDAQREKTLAVAAQASADTQVAIRKEVADTFLAAQRVLVDSSLAVATDNAVSVGGSARSMSMEAYNPSSISFQAPQADATTMMAVDAKMFAEADVDAVESSRSVIDELFARIAEIRVFLQTNLQIDKEVRGSIEADLDKASVWAEGPQLPDAVALIAYIETFLGITFESSYDGNTTVGSDTDPAQPRPTPMPMPVDIDFGGTVDGGYGVDGNTGSGSIEPGIMIDGAGGASLGGDMIDTSMNVNADLETSSSFGF